jgi:hypothetical protein
MTRTPKTIQAAERLGRRDAKARRAAPDAQVVEATTREVGYAYVRAYQAQRLYQAEATCGRLGAVGV